MASDYVDVSVKSSPGAADKPNSPIRRPNLFYPFYPLKTGQMAAFPGKPQ
jgi:hypothetical protein